MLASGYRMMKATALNKICRTTNNIVSFSSCIGPNHFNAKLIRVQLVPSKMISPSLSVSVTPTTPRSRYTFRMSLPKGFRFASLNWNLLGSSRPVSTLILGSLCLGHGKKWKSWGIEKMKLATWGTKNSKAVLLKWPKIATTAMVIPEK